MFLSTRHMVSSDASRTWVHLDVVKSTRQANQHVACLSPRTAVWYLHRSWNPDFRAMHLA